MDTDGETQLPEEAASKKKRKQHRKGNVHPYCS